MKPGVAIALLLVIVIPAALFVASAVRMNADSRMVLAHRLGELRQQTLQEVERDLLAWLEGNARALDGKLEQVPLTTEALRELVRGAPRVRQALRMGEQGERLFPPRDRPHTGQEARFLVRTEDLWRDHGILYPAAAEGRLPDRGWYTWYWGEEMNLIRWLRREDGSVLGVELEPARLAADAIGAISSDAPPGALLRIRNEKGEVLYQWGADETDPAAPASAVRPLQAPLASWRLEYVDAFGRPEAVTPLWVIAAVSLATLLMIALAGYLYRAQRREMQIAGQRVSFVNQVSHELKTPLTNLRMYSELLERELPEEDGKPRRYLAVIQSEAERLSRLISNVLSFARSERSTLQITTRPTDIGDVVRAVMASFRPALEQAGIEVTLELPPPEQAALDGDAIGQILNNLVGNVEKYATGGAYLGVAVRRAGDQLEIRVRDRGPGIPAGREEQVFEPFFRVDNRLSGAAAGTGIGLSVSRELARLHGGDLRLETAPAGACFLLAVHAPLAGGAA